jgi:hypothetical protein
VNIAVVSTFTPFERSAVDELRDELARRLVASGHAVEEIRIPLLSWETVRVLDTMIAIRLLHVRLIDLVVALDFPSYYVRHPQTVVWALQGSERVAEREDACRLVRSADHVFLVEARAVLAGSSAVAENLRAASVPAEVLPVPRDEREWSYTLERLLNSGRLKRTVAEGQESDGPENGELADDARETINRACDRLGTEMRSLEIDPLSPVVSRVAAALAALADVTI